MPKRLSECGRYTFRQSYSYSLIKIFQRVLKILFNMNVFFTNIIASKIRKTIDSLTQSVYNL